MIIKKSLINEFLVVLMALILILSQTTLHFTQVLLELTLIFMLTFLLLKRKLKLWEISLLLTIIITQLMSMLIYDYSLYSVILNTKVTGIVFLSLLYFKDNATSSISMKLCFVVCLSLVLIQYFITSEFPIPIPESLIKNLSIYNHHQPLGLFLNFHTSAYFLAVYFIGINLTRKLFFIDLIIIWLMAVRTSFLALIGQKVFNFAGNRFDIFKKASVQITLVIVGSLFLLTVILPLFFSFMDMVGMGRGRTTTIMARLIINPDLYLDALRYLPMDYDLYLENFVYDTGISVDSNESALISIMIIFGTPIALIFFYLMLKLTPSFRVFILLTLLHFSAILNPLIIYLVFMFENNQRQIKEES